MSIVVADFDPFDPLVAADPYPWYSLLRRDAPVHHVASHDLWVVSRYEHVRTVLGDTSTFSNEAMAA
ncbi:MAG: cytochrome P450, partial [Acidimicrobiales bacterium]